MVNLKNYVGVFHIDNFERQEVEALNNTSITNEKRLELLAKGAMFFQAHNFMKVVNNQEFNEEGNWIAFINELETSID